MYDSINENMIQIRTYKRGRLGTNLKFSLTMKNLIFNKRTKIVNLNMLFKKNLWVQSTIIEGIES